MKTLRLTATHRELIDETTFVRRRWRVHRTAVAVRSDHEFLDFAVDGESLASRIAQADDGRRGPLAEVPVLALDWPSELPTVVRRLTGALPSPLPDGRMPLYVCAQCADLGCGAVTAVIEHREKTVIWRDFGYQYDYEPFSVESLFTRVAPLEFDRDAYLATLEPVAVRATSDGDT